MRLLSLVLAIVVALVAGLASFDYFAPQASMRLGLEFEHRRAGLGEYRVQIPGFEVAYLDGGRGEPLLLIHGFGADKDNFTWVAGRLTSQYRVVIPDLPGYGSSSKPDTTYSIAEQVERLRAFMQALGIKRAHLGGNSMGGWIATVWAAKYPAEVASLWLLAPAGTSAAFDSELMRTYRQTGEVLLVAKTLDEFARLRGFVMSRPPPLPYSFKRLLGERAVADYALHRKVFVDGVEKEQPLEKAVSRVDAPALIVWGTEDRALNPRGAEAMKALLPNGRVVLMPGIGHLPMVEAVRRSAEDYLAFRQALPR